MNLVISKGNKKLGNIPSFSLTSIKSCPEATNWCSSNCYASKLERLYPNVRKSYLSNLELSMKDDFIEIMDKELKRLSSKKSNPIKFFRIHVSGDFYSKEYVDKWISIISNNTNIIFYAYTRTWKSKNLDFLASLEMLKALPNMTLLASVDNDTVSNNIIPNKEWRVAYAGDNKPENISYVYCLEQSKKIDSCENCKLCFNLNLKKSNINIYFSTH